jgi:DNA-binding winged helix-turn-helix (wHTH) protein
LSNIFGIKDDQEDPIFNLIFSFEGHFSESELYNGFGKLFERMGLNKRFVSGFTVDEINEVLTPIIENSKEVSTKIHTMTGGNPKLVDRILDIIADDLSGENKSFDLAQLTGKRIASDFVIKYALSSIYESIGTIENLDNISNDKEFLEYLLGVGLIQKSDGKYKNNFDLYINNDIENNIIKQSAKDHQNIIKTDELSSQEFEVFTKIKEANGEIVSKEDIANLIGIDNKDEKRKDWAIDQLIKRLREKIEDDEKEIIKTIRGRGYKFGL